MLELDSIITVLTIALQGYSVFVAADILIGIAHHSLDVFSSPSRWPREVSINNLNHHAVPTLILRHGPIANAAETLPIGFAIVVVAWMFGFLNWQIGVFSATVGFSSIYHRIQHIPRQRVCTVVRVLQSWHVLQPRWQHARHHAQHSTFYSVWTSAANWILERTRLLQGIEWLIMIACKIRPTDMAAAAMAARMQFVASTAKK